MFFLIYEGTGEDRAENPDVERSNESGNGIGKCQMLHVVPSCMTAQGVRGHCGICCVSCMDEM